MEGAGEQLIKFSGLGHYGRAAHERARALAATGFGPSPRALRHGFLAMDFVRGRPLSPAESNPRLLEAAADYVAAVAGLDRSPEPVPLASLLEMVRQNVAEALGREWTESLPRLPGRRGIEPGRAIAIDGRMLPHEWLVSGGRYVKTDGVDHHDDHLFPGRQDVAWDVAGTIVEFELDEAAEREFVVGLRATARRPAASGRVPFYTVAYLPTASATARSPPRAWTTRNGSASSRSPYAIGGGSRRSCCGRHLPV